MYGLKISNPGVDVGTSDPRTTSMRSDFNMFKIHSDGTAFGTIQAGEQAGTVTFTHNLGYVPAFWTYYIGTDNKQRLLSYLPEGIGGQGEISSYAGTDTIKCVFDFGAAYNQNVYQASDFYNTWAGGSLLFLAGDRSGGKDGAIRFTNLALNKNESVLSAVLDVHVASKGTNTNNLKIITRGIDEDNTADFSSSPMGRSQTAASGTQEQSMTSPTPFNFGINVKSQLEEINSRSGWSSGNAMGFFVINNASPTDCYFSDAYTESPNSFLTVTRQGSATFGFRALIFKDKVSEN